MNTYSTFHLHGGETIRDGGGSDALVITGPDASTVGLFFSQMPVGDRLRFLRELSEAAGDLADEITVRELRAEVNAS